jgi:hypothetical protein
MLDAGFWILDAGCSILDARYWMLDSLYCIYQNLESNIQNLSCYLWVNKKTNEPYIGFVDGKFIDDPDLIADKRSRMKILMLNASKDIPVKKIGGIVKTLIKLRKARKK